MHLKTIKCPFNGRILEFTFHDDNDFLCFIKCDLFFTLYHYFEFIPYQENAWQTEALHGPSQFSVG